MLGAPSHDPSRRTGLLVATAWLERGPERRLRVRIVQKMDAEATEEDVTAAGTIDEACAIFRAWLEKVSAG